MPAFDALKPMTVSQLNVYIKSRFDSDSLLGSVAICGEISNCKKYASGHIYFSLKDAEGLLSCVMFRSNTLRLRFQPKDGMQVVAFGRVTVFPRDGRYQLYVDMMMPDGAGDLNAAFEQLKAKLNAEGLFSSSHKKRIPSMPNKIALITSASGAAVRDMIRILGARWPLSKVLVMPVRVQGAEAPGELIGALRYANQWRVADVIIIGRGGGSIEDLWAFNDELLAREIYRSEIPVISAVGHEPDVTISDYVADVRAATPSNAAELAVPDQNEVYAQLNQLRSRLGHVMRERLQRERMKLDRCTASRAICNPITVVQDRRVLLDYQQQRLKTALERNITHHRTKYAALCASLDSLSPLKVLSRGYALAQTDDGKVITSVVQIQTGENVHFSMRDGVLDCTVLERRTN